jgi:hypothetical protein
MTLTQSYTNVGLINITNTRYTPVGYSGTDGFRIDNVVFNGAGSTFRAAHIVGLVGGVFDNDTFNAGTSSVFIGVSSYAYVNAEYPTNEGGTSWENLPLDLGGPSAIYIENCTFNGNPGGTALVEDSWMGGRFVVRYNTINSMDVFVHAGEPGNMIWRGGLKLEVYNNVFTDPIYMSGIIRSGTGVIFNNTVAGGNFVIDNQRTCCLLPISRCDGKSSYDGNAQGGYGWPCMDQVGRGGGHWGSQTSVPIYAWNNGPQSKCSNPSASGPFCDGSIGISVFQVGTQDPGYCPGGATNYCIAGPTPPVPNTHFQSGRDYVNNGSTPKPGYTPYTYPHPLNKPAPAPPQNLRIM